MRHPYLWAFGTSAGILLTELLLTRVLDVILSANTAFTVVTAALFGSGMGAAWAALRPVRDDMAERRRLLISGWGTALCLVLMLPLCNLSPFAVRSLFHSPHLQIPGFILFFGILLAPFVLHGFGLATLFQRRAPVFPRLYFADLTGAAAGALALPLVLPPLGPFGVLCLGATLAGLGTCDVVGPPESSTKRQRNRRVWILRSLLLLPLILWPFLDTSGIAEIDFRTHAKKRGPEEAALRESAEFRRWDPVSKIEVVDLPSRERARGDSLQSKIPGGLPHRKLISYDGGSQSSHIYAFDGDFESLYPTIPDRVLDHFWQRGVLAGHYFLAQRNDPQLARTSDARCLVIGCAGGQEVKAARLYGAREIDAIDLVQTVVDLGRHTYADFNGHLFAAPGVRFWRDEARSWLTRSRGTEDDYDLIQIFSYHNSSRIASGALAIQSFYLHTSEAYALYFSRLTEAGVLQVSQAFPQRVVATAAEAWRALGRDEFQRHVVIFTRQPVDDHPTILFKMTPWTDDEVAVLRAFFGEPSLSEPWTYKVLQDPTRPQEGFLSPAFFAGDEGNAFFDSLPLRLGPVRDNQPFYHFVRKSLSPVPVDLGSFVDSSTVHIVERRRFDGMAIPRDLIHLFMSAGACLLAGLLVVAVPLRRAPAGHAGWPGRPLHLLYFACLGMGFIIFELGTIQTAILIIGFPVYAYTTVIATFLGFGGLGSAWAGRWLERNPVAVSPKAGAPVTTSSASAPAHARRHLVILSLLVAVAALSVGVREPWGELWMSRSLFWRVAGVVLGTAPLAFLLGMPMPWGMIWLRGAPTGAISWAWAINSVATVSGGLVMILVALHWGISSSLWLGVAVYAAAVACAARSWRRRAS